MNLQIQGSKPPTARSARSQSRINPITGEEIVYSVRDQYSARTPRNDVNETGDARPVSTKPTTRPDGVPALNLGKLGRQKDDIGNSNNIPLEMDPYSIKLASPGPDSAVSWGTPSSAYIRARKKQQMLREQQDYIHKPENRGSTRPEGVPAIDVSSRSGTPVQKGHKDHHTSAWDKQPVPEDLPAPSARYKQQYKEYEADIRESYRKACGSHRPKDEGKQVDSELRLNLESSARSSRSEREDTAQKLQQDWTTQPYSEAHLQKKKDIEELENQKKINKMIETVMIDQLSRGVMCDPEQNTILSTRPPQYQPGMTRGTVRNLHDSKVKTNTSATENLLSKRVRFGARILTRNGRDAIRELTGFFFAVDNSLTIYEFRQFGKKSAKAMPFIKRGCYSRLTGRKRGEMYTLVDICEGANIQIETKDQPLPDGIKEQSIATFRITDIENDVKEAILLANVPLSEKQSVWNDLHLPQSEQEKKDFQLQERVQSCIRRQLRKRGVKTITGICQLFRNLDESGDGKLNKYELEKAMVDFRIDVPQEDVDDLWELLDTDCSSFLDYSEFFRGFFGEMSEKRKTLVRKAFRKIDSSKQGWITLGDMSKFYNAYKHPKVKSGKCTEHEVLGAFLDSFKVNCKDNTVTYSHFEEYYEGLSIGIAKDEDFTNILQNAWSI